MLRTQDLHSDLLSGLINEIKNGKDVFNVRRKTKNGCITCMICEKMQV